MWSVVLLFPLHSYVYSTALDVVVDAVGSGSGFTQLGLLGLLIFSHLSLTLSPSRINIHTHRVKEKKEKKERREGERERGGSRKKIFFSGPKSVSLFFDVRPFWSSPINQMIIFPISCSYVTW